MISINTQYSLLLNSIIFGIYLGITYDILKFFATKRYWLHVTKDILFWIVQGLISGYFFYKISNGIIPIMLFLLFLAGYLIYSLTLKKCLNKYFIQNIQSLKSIVKANKKLIFFLLAFDLYAKLRTFIKKAFKKRKQDVNKS